MNTNQGCVSSVVGWGISAVLMGAIGGFVGYIVTVAHSAILGALLGVLGGEVCLAILFVLVQFIGWDGISAIGEGCACCGEILSIFGVLAFVLLGSGIGSLLWHNTWLGMLAGGSCALSISIVCLVLVRAWQQEMWIASRMTTRTA